MPKVAYSEEERQQIRDDLIRTALELMAEQGIQHTTVEQIYKKVGPLLSAAQNHCLRKSADVRSSFEMA